jgi:cyclic pyranopterin phosphate synthase
MPREAFGDDFQFLPRSEILSFEEIFRLTRIFRGLGVEKIRLTGGEPLLRTDLAVLVGQLSAIPGIELVMTTNGSLLAAKSRPRVCRE